MLVGKVHWTNNTEARITSMEGWWPEIMAIVIDSSPYRGDYYREPDAEEHDAFEAGRPSNVREMLVL
jgi:hypothetical protein